MFALARVEEKQSEGGEKTEEKRDGERKEEDRDRFKRGQRGDTRGIYMAGSS